MWVIKFYETATPIYVKRYRINDKGQVVALSYIDTVDEATIFEKYPKTEPYHFIEQYKRNDFWDELEDFFSLK